MSTPAASSAQGPGYQSASFASAEQLFAHIEAAIALLVIAVGAGSMAEARRAKALCYCPVGVKTIRGGKRRSAPLCGAPIDAEMKPLD
jgi:hypothetical protein